MNLLTAADLDRLGPRIRSQPNVTTRGRRNGAGIGFYSCCCKGHAIRRLQLRTSPIGPGSLLTARHAVAAALSSGHCKPQTTLRGKVGVNADEHRCESGRIPRLTGNFTITFHRSAALDRLVSSQFRFHHADCEAARVFSRSGTALALVYHRNPKKRPRGTSRPTKRRSQAMKVGFVESIDIQ